MDKRHRPQRDCDDEPMLLGYALGRIEAKVDLGNFRLQRILKLLREPDGDISAEDEARMAALLKDGSGPLQAAIDANAPPKGL